MVSVVAGQYQKLRVELPAGTVIVWLSVLSPSGSAPDTTPRAADPPPPCAPMTVVDGGTIPAAVHEVNPSSNPPLWITEASAAGFGGPEGAALHSPVGADTV